MILLIELLSFVNPDVFYQKQRTMQFVLDSQHGLKAEPKIRVEMIVLDLSCCQPRFIFCAVFS